MMVRIIDCPAHGPETVQVEACDLRECYPDQGEDYARALAELEKTGRYWDGGGAAPLVRLERLGHEPQGLKAPFAIRTEDALSWHTIDKTLAGVAERAGYRVRAQDRQWQVWATDGDLAGLQTQTHVWEFDVLALSRDLAFIHAAERALDGALLSVNLLCIPYTEDRT